MQNQVNNLNLQNSTQGDAMAASSAMVVSGLEKELKTNKANITINDPKINLKELEEYIQKLSNTSEIEKVKKREERKHKENQENPKNYTSFKMATQTTEPAEPFEWKTKEKVSGNFIFDLFSSFQRSVLQNLLDYAFKPGIEELVKSASELKIFIDGLNFEKISIKDKGRTLLTSELSEEDRKYLFLSDELKILELGVILEEDWIKLVVIKMRRNYVLKTLIEIRTGEDIIIKIKIQAKEIAWLKIIHELKASHLKRVFCGSSVDFDYYSRVIAYYTNKLRKIDIDRPQNERDMIKTRLHQIAVETAQYKLGLLRSMQKLSFDKARETDILWLETTLKHLKHA